MEHSAILVTCIKLPFVIKICVLSIFEWPLKTGSSVMLNLCIIASPVAAKSPKPSKSGESKQTAPKKDKRIEVEVKVSYFLSPSEFHVQLASAAKDGLDE